MLLRDRTDLEDGEMSIRLLNWAVMALNVRRLSIIIIIITAFNTDCSPMMEQSIAGCEYVTSKFRLRFRLPFQSK